MATPISTDTLKGLGFIKSGSTYTKGALVIKYDGVYWYANDEKIEDNLEIIKKICTYINS